jgi:uncharacterized damage-inducible protein DinB
MTTRETLVKLFTRDLVRLEKEIKEYTSQESLWLISKGVNNSSGNLCLHLCGNLQHYIGNVLGNSGYKRNREAEFSTKGLTKEDLLLEIEKTKESVISTLNKLSEEVVDTVYPEEVFNEPMKTGYFLIHLQGHLNYHLGQINYNRRLSPFN